MVIPTCVFEYVCVFVRARESACLCACVRVCVEVRMPVCEYICICVYVCSGVWSCVYNVLFWKFACLCAQCYVHTHTQFDHLHNPSILLQFICDLCIVSRWWFTLSVRVGSERRPKHLAVRFVFLSWWFFCIIIVAIYGANLVAFLAVSQRSLPFETLEEMTAQTDYKYGMMGGTVWTDFFKVWTMKHV